MWYFAVLAMSNKSMGTPVGSRMQPPVFSSVVAVRVILAKGVRMYLPPFHATSPPHQSKHHFALQN
jgi:hypothetical protein